LIRGHVIESAAELGSIVDQWDELAVEASEPFCSPAWMLAWWRNAAPADAALRAVAVLDGRELVGVAPMFAQRGTSGLARYALLASPMSLRAAPLARRGREQEAAAVIAEALATASPYPDIVTFAGIGQISSWPSLLQRAWPGSRRPLLFEEQTIPAPYVSLEGRSFDEWFASKSPNFRQQIRRRRRQLEAAGAVFRLAAADEVVRDLRAFAALHHARWRPRGGSGVLDQNVERMLEDVAPVLAANGRMRVFAIDVEDRPISVQIFVGTGGEFSYWLGGFDAAWSAQQPSMQGLVAAIEHAFHAGDGVLDLGGGGIPSRDGIDRGKREHMRPRAGAKHDHAEDADARSRACPCDREVTDASCELGEAPAEVPGGEVYGDDQFVGLEDGGPWPDNQIGGAQHSRPASRPDLELGVKRYRRRQLLRRRVGMGKAAAERPAGADCEVSHRPCGLGQQGGVRAHLR